MKTMTGALAALLAVTALTACGTNASNDSGKSPETAASRESAEAAKQRLYLEMARKELPGARDENLLAIRTQTCAAFKGDPSMSTYIAMLGKAKEGGLTAEQFGSVTALAVASNCPEYENLLHP